MPSCLEGIIRFDVTHVKCTMHNVTCHIAIKGIALIETQWRNCCQMYRAENLGCQDYSKITVRLQYINMHVC